MKKMVIEGGAMVAYISNKDVNMLAGIYKVVDPIVFCQRSIALEQYTPEGLYKLEDAMAVEYIGKVPYILDESYVGMLGSKEVSKLIEKATEDADNVGEIFERLCAGKMSLPKSHKEMLKSLSGVDKNLVKAVKREVKKGKKASLEKIKELKFYVTEQLMYYISTLENAAKEKTQ